MAMVVHCTVVKKIISIQVDLVREGATLSVDAQWDDFKTNVH
jgi:hypothetical protein